MHILFLVPYPLGEAPSQRFRFEQYLNNLKARGHTYVFESFMDIGTWQFIYKPGNYFLKTLGIIKSFFRRFLVLFKVSQFDLVFIHREATPLGPPVIEWIIAKILKKKIIYDFDDAIWIANTSDENALISKIKYPDKVAKICQWSYKISCGNAYILDFAQQFNSNAFYSPTTIDTENLHNPALYKRTRTEESPLIIGWTGTHSTLPYLSIIMPVLEALEQTYTFTFQVIANKSPDFKLKEFQFKTWNKETEIQDLLSFDIGLMPLAEDRWAEGKCGFKALQYMALEIPAVVSPVGVNSEIVQEGISGFLCKDSDEWYNKIEKLLLDAALRKEMGIKGREKVIKDYSVLSNTDNFLELFDK